MKKLPLEFPAQIDPVRRDLEAWRRNRKYRQPIPESIWQAMADLSRVHGVNAVSRALRVSYYDLKRHVTGELAPAKHREPPAFVELSLPPSANPGCVIELEERGAKMTLRMPAGSVADPIAIIQTFWRRGA